MTTTNDRCARCGHKKPLHNPLLGICNADNCDCRGFVAPAPLICDCMSALDELSGFESDKHLPDCPMYKAPAPEQPHNDVSWSCRKGEHRDCKQCNCSCHPSMMTPELRKDFEKVRAELRASFKELTDPLRESARISADDLATRVNSPAPEDAESVQGEEIPSDAPLPCPLCGGTVEATTYDRSSSSAGGFTLRWETIISCNTCDLTIRRDKKADAFNVWNRRASVPPPDRWIGWDLEHTEPITERPAGTSREKEALDRVWDIVDSADGDCTLRQAHQSLELIADIVSDFEAVPPTEPIGTGETEGRLADAHYAIRLYCEHDRKYCQHCAVNCRDGEAHHEWCIMCVGGVVRPIGTGGEASEPSDGDMLDWLTKERAEPHVSDDGWWLMFYGDFGWRMQEGYHDTPRAAIRAAMKQEAK